jgi:hypothetical protein
MTIRCCFCRSPAWYIGYSKGWHTPHCNNVVCEIAANKVRADEWVKL